MKRFVILALCLLMVLGLVSCAESATTTTATSATTATAATTVTEATTAATTSTTAKPLDFPKGDVTIICPFGAGGGTDAMGRVIADIASKKTGQNFLVVNKTGGSGAVGMGEGANAKPDGYTISMITVEVNLLPLAGLTNFQPDDLSPLVLFNYDADAIFVKADSKYHTLADLVNEGKANPGDINLMVAAFPSHPWIAGALLAEQSGAEFNLIQEAGGAAEQMTALLGGHVDAIAVTAAEGKAYVDSGDFRCLAVCAEGIIDGVPTFADSGYNINVGTWRGLAVPKDTPQEIKDYLEKLFSEIAASQELKDFLKSRSFGERFLNSADFAALIKSEYEQYKPIVEKYQK